MRVSRRQRRATEAEHSVLSGPSTRHQLAVGSSAHCRVGEEPQADRERVAERLAFLGGLELVDTRGRGGCTPSSAPSSASRSRTRARRSSSMSRARSFATRASCERAKTASAVSRPGGYWRVSSDSSQRSAASLRTAVLAEAVEGHARAEAADAPERGGRRDRCLVLDEDRAERLLDLGREPFEAGGASPHLGQLVRLGLRAVRLSSPGSCPWAGAGRGRAGGGSRRGGAGQAGGDATPEDPPLGPALHVLRVAHPLVEDRPEGLDPDLVHREAAARPEHEAGEVEPSGFVLRALEPVVGQVAERVPERPQGRGRPLGRAARRWTSSSRLITRAGGVRSAARTCRPGTRRGSPRPPRRSPIVRGRRRSVSWPVIGPAAVAWPAGPRSWIWSRHRRSSVRDWHQSSTVPTSVTRAARLTGTRSAFALRPDAHQALEWRQLADRVGIGATSSPGWSSGRTELLASGNATGWPISRSKSCPAIAISSPSWASRGDDAEPGPVGRPRPRSRRRTIGPCRRRSGCRRRAGPRRNTPRRGRRPGRARDWSGPAGHRRRRGRQRTTTRGPRPRDCGRCRASARRR